jgi:hypothetical protein
VLPFAAVARGAVPADAPANHVFDGLTVDAATAAALRRLDPDAITGADIRATLVHFPAPRIIAFNGSLPLVTMEPFARFLAAMGYPEAQLRNPADGSYTYNSFADSRELAGALAWHCERDGVAPVLLGHSQGGMTVIRVLHELAGGGELPVYDPMAQAVLPRTTFIDPVTGNASPSSALRVPYAAAIATGKAMRVLLGQWDMLSRLRKIPDSVEDFDGFFIPGDPFTAFDGGDDRYRALGSAQVRNVELPASTSHLGAPRCLHLSSQPATRAWIQGFDPRAPAPLPDESRAGDTSNLVHAAYIWHAVKRHWCRGAQRLLEAQARPAAGPDVPSQ